MAMSSIPTLQTERLTLRALSEDDFDSVATFYESNDSAMYGGPCNRATAWRKFAVWFGHWELRGYGPWAIEHTETGEFIGWTGMWSPEGWPEPEITYALLTEHQGKGYATEAAARALRSAYEDFGWKTAVSVIDDRNTGSIALVERLGATKESAVDLFGQPAHVYRHGQPPQRGV